MKRAGRKFLVAFLVILPFFLCWVTTVAAPAYRTNPDFPAKIDLPANMEESGTKPISLILLGAGLLNLSIWGRNQYRKGRTNPGESV